MGKATPQPDSRTPAPTTRAIMLAIVASLELTASDAFRETAPAQHHSRLHRLTMGELTHEYSRTRT